MPFGLQPTHLILLVIVALLIFGPARLPEIGRSFGKMLGEFRMATGDVSRAVTPLDTSSAPRSAPAQVQCRACAQPIQSGKRFCAECGADQTA